MSNLIYKLTFAYSIGLFGMFARLAFNGHECITFDLLAKKFILAVFAISVSKPVMNHFAIPYLIQISAFGMTGFCSRELLMICRKIFLAMVSKIDKE